MSKKNVKFSDTSSIMEIPYRTQQQKKQLFTSGHEQAVSRKAASVSRTCPVHTITNREQCPYFTYKCYDQRTNKCYNMYDSNDSISGVGPDAPKILPRHQVIRNQQFKNTLDKWVQNRKARQLRESKARVRAVLMKGNF